MSVWNFHFRCGCRSVRARVKCFALTIYPTCSSSLSIQLAIRAHDIFSAHWIQRGTNWLLQFCIAEKSDLFHVAAAHLLPPVWSREIAYYTAHFPSTPLLSLIFCSSLLRAQMTTYVLTTYISLSIVVGLDERFYYLLICRRDRSTAGACSKRNNWNWIIAIHEHLH